MLRGAAEALRRNGPVLLIEAEERHYPNAVGEVLLLSQFGYSGYFEVDGTPDGPSMNSMPKSTKTRQT